MIKIQVNFEETKSSEPVVMKRCSEKRVQKTDATWQIERYKQTVSMLMTVTFRVEKFLSDR